MRAYPAAVMRCALDLIDEALGAALISVALLSVLIAFARLHRRASPGSDDPRPYQA